MKRLFLILLVVSTLLVTGCLATDRLEGTTFFKNIDADHITLGGEPLLIPAYGEMYITAPFTLTCPTAGTDYLASNVTASGEMKGFANNGLGRMTYTDVTGARVALVNVTITLAASLPDVPTTASVRIYRNGAADIPSTVVLLLSTGAKVEALPMVSLITLMNTGDYLEIGVSCDKDDVDLTISTMAMIITTVD